MIRNSRFHCWHHAQGLVNPTIEVADGLRLNVWNVHLQAGGADGIRSRQVAELVGWVQASQDGQIADLVAGDFNCTPESRQYSGALSADRAERPGDQRRAWVYNV
jgi:endonuclease/exonuclease/phosphatase family metal-dependent hydrolase